MLSSGSSSTTARITLRRPAVCRLTNHKASFLLAKRAHIAHSRGSDSMTIEQQRSCKMKRFTTEDAAKRCLWAMQQNKRGKDLIVVRCVVCRGWHFRRKL